MHKIICNQKLSELEGFAIFHETWAQHLKGSALSKTLSRAQIYLKLYLDNITVTETDGNRWKR